MTAPKRPGKVVVGPYTFSVCWTEKGWSDAREAAVAGYDPDLGYGLGFTDRRNLAIWINPNAPLDYQREALFHEVMHCCQAVANLPNSGQVVSALTRAAEITGEDFITRISPLIVDTLRRNPVVNTFITGK